MFIKVEDELFSNPGDALDLLWDMLCDDNTSHSDIACGQARQTGKTALDPEGKLLMLLGTLELVTTFILHCICIYRT